MNCAFVSSSTLGERAARVHAFLAQTFPLQLAEQMVSELRPHWFEPTKALAKRVRADLATPLFPQAKYDDQADYSSREVCTAQGAM